MPDKIIALYVGNSVYPMQGTDPMDSVRLLQSGPLTSPILSLLNQSANQPDLLVYNDANNPVFNNHGDYIGDSSWKDVIEGLKSGGDVEEVYLSFSTNGTEYMGNLLNTNPVAAQNILNFIKIELGFAGIDLDYEGFDFSPNSAVFQLASAAITAGLKLTAAPYNQMNSWESWVQHVENNKGTVSWLNLQCYAGGKSNNPGDWLGIGAPIVAGSCNSCGGPLTTCSPSDMQALFRLWTTGNGSVSRNCWTGKPNVAPEDLAGGFIWTFSSIRDHYNAYMDAVKTGLGE